MSGNPPALAPPLGEGGRQALQIGHGRRVREGGFVERRVERLFERHHHLDALERTEPELFERGRGIDGAPAGKPAMTDSTLVPAISPRRAPRLSAATREFRDVSVSSSLRSRQLVSRPHARGSNALMIGQLRVGESHHVVWIDTWFDDERDMDALFTVLA
jgi:hypothetical protein